MIDNYNSLFLVFLNFAIISVLNTIMNFFALVTIMELATHCCNKKLKLSFHKLNLGLQSLSYVGPSTWNNLPDNLKTTTNVNCFKHEIKKYFLKKLGENEADIYSYA